MSTEFEPSAPLPERDAEVNLAGLTGKLHDRATAAEAELTRALGQLHDCRSSARVLAVRAQNAEAEVASLRDTLAFVRAEHATTRADLAAERETNAGHMQGLRDCGTLARRQRAITEAVGRLADEVDARRMEMCRACRNPSTHGAHDCGQTRQSFSEALRHALDAAIRLEALSPDTEAIRPEHPHLATGVNGGLGTPIPAGADDAPDEPKGVDRQSPHPAPVATPTEPERCPHVAEPGSRHEDEDCPCVETGEA